MPSARFAGVPVPRSAPTFRTERFGLWAENSRTNSATGNSPVLSGTEANGSPLRHFSTNGNAYWNLTLNSADSTAMSWDKEDYFGIKMYIRPRSVAGRIQVFRKGESGRGGPFFDIVDGKGRFGWWDNGLKKEVWVETSGQVFWPGRVHYVYLRKRWPPQNTTGGNWEDSFYTNLQIRRLVFSGAYAPTVGATISSADGTAGRVLRLINSTTADVYTTTNALTWGGVIDGGALTATATVPTSDLFIVKRFAQSTDTSRDITGFDAYIDATGAAVTRNAVSFTSADATRSPGVDAVGVVSPVGATFTGLAAGQIESSDMDASGAAEYYVPRLEMDSMYFTWGTGAGAEFEGKTYRILQILPAGGSAGQALFTLRNTFDLTSAPDFSTVPAGTPGQISTGIQLIKSPEFDSSKSPDNSGNTIYFMGSPDQGKATSTYQPFDGEVWCPGWMVDAPASAGVDGCCFEDVSAVTTDPVLIGTDYFEQETYAVANTALEHQLQFTTGYVRFAWDGRLYGGADIVASTQPQALPADAIGTTGPTIAVNALSPPITGTSKPFWEYVQPRSVWSDERFVAVGFRDPVQGIYGRPGPTARIKPLEDDTTNPSGVVRVTITDLPVGPQGMEVVVYESASGGDASTLFEAARVPNGTSEVAVEVLESLLSLGQAADFAADPPPRCSVLAASAERMVYGAVEFQPDGCIPSRVGRPGLADYATLFRLSGGNGDKITGLLDLDGQLAVFKRRAMGAVVFTQQGFPVVQMVSTGVGCIAHQTLQSKDSLLWFLSDRGVQISRRDGVSNLGRPIYVGEPVERFFTSETDLRKIVRASGAINRGRNQYVVALRVEDQTLTNTRITAEMRGEEISFSRYLGPNLTALATVQPREPGAEVLVGGTEEGFVVWLDRADTSLILMGPDSREWGAFQLTSYGGTSSTTGGLDTQSVSEVDGDLAGPMGVTGRYNDADGTERLVSLLGADGRYLHYAETLLAAVPVNHQIMIGAQQLLWETPWLDMGNPERLKQLKYIDLILETRDLEPTGTIYWELYRDWDLDNVLDADTLVLGQVPYRISPDGVNGRWFKLRLTHAPNTSDVRFDLAQIVWRVTDEDQV